MTSTDKTHDKTAEPPIVESPGDGTAPVPAVSAMTRLLRLVGAGLLVSSASTFMIQQWDAGNDLFRYLVLLGHTVVLAGAGLFCGVKIQESRGARTFLGLVLISVPIHFAVLGGLIYSQFSLDGRTQAVARHIMWTAGSKAEALGLVGLGMVFLLPISMMATAVFARPFSKQLTASYLALNLALLVPVRGADEVGALAGLSLVLFFVLQKMLFMGKPLLRTPEGRFVRFILLAPIGVLVGRSLYLYQLSLLSVGILLTALGLLAFVFSSYIESHDRLVRAIQGMSVAPIVIGWGIIVIDLLSFPAMPDAMTIPLSALPAAVLIVAISSYSRGQTLIYRRIAAMAVLVPLTLNLLLFSGLWVSLICLGAGIVTLLFGIFIQQKLVAVAGIAQAAFGTIYHVHTMVRVETVGHWAVLSIIGIGLIIGASVFESRSKSALRYLAGVRDKIAAWEY